MTYTLTEVSASYKINNKFLILMSVEQKVLTFLKKKQHFGYQTNKPQILSIDSSSSGIWIDDLSIAIDLANKHDDRSWVQIPLDSLYFLVIRTGIVKLMYSRQIMYIISTVIDISCPPRTNNSQSGGCF